MIFRGDDMPVTRGELRNALKKAYEGREREAAIGGDMEYPNYAISNALDEILHELEDDWSS